MRKGDKMVWRRKELVSKLSDGTNLASMEDFLDREQELIFWQNWNKERKWMLEKGI